METNPNGKTFWSFADGFIPAESKGDQLSHESICILNITNDKAELEITLYFEDRHPIKNITEKVDGERTRHIRTDSLSNDRGETVPVGVPYAMTVKSNIPVIAQYSRLDSSQTAMALMTTLGY